MTAISDGFRRIDLHIHTPFSACYIDHMKPEANRRTQPEEILDAAVAAGLDAIAVTDHNGAEMIDRFRPLAAERGLTIFPGTELSTRGGHLLAIFDVDIDVDVIRDLLGAIKFRPEQWGDGYQRTDVWMDVVIDEIARRGGLAIPAHVDREPRGFLASDERPSDKARIYNHEQLAALEITDPRRKERWNRGADPRYTRPRACVQSSDAHAPEEVGRRPVLVQIQELRLASLREALLHYDDRVRFPAEM
ncbi:MAG: PHP domain-containing protein [Dehalococcoidia bacterium]